MTPPDFELEVAVKWDATERRELYRILDINNKLAIGQVRLVLLKTVYSRPPPGFPPGAVSQFYAVKLTVNDYEICRVHTYELNGRLLRPLDPKWFKIDRLTIKQ